MLESTFYCKPAKGERIETRLQITPDLSAAIHGVVLDPEGGPVAAAFVLLFRVEEEATPLLLAQSATDRDGHFVFGGLEGDTLYRIKVFQQNWSVRTLELRPSSGDFTAP